MTDSLRKKLVPRMHLLFVGLILITLIGLGARPHETHAQGGATVNVPAVHLYFNCSGSWKTSYSVEFYYIQLDGTINVREATVSNGRMVYTRNGTPAIVFEQLSMNWWSQDAWIVFYESGNYTSDRYIGPGRWNEDHRSGIIHRTFGC